MWWYNLGIHAYGRAIRIASPFMHKAKLWTRGRRDIFARLSSAVGSGNKIVWIHSSSLGEFEQGRPIIEAIRRRYSEYKILLTFFSPSGYEVRRNYEGVDWVFYLPADTPRNARRFLDIVNPAIAIFIKYEFWLNYLDELRRRNCRSYIVSAIFRRDSIFFKPYGRKFREALRRFSHIFVQDRASEKLLAEIGVESVTVAGDTRFDRVADIAANAGNLPVIKKFCAGERVFIAGSTWPHDEALVLDLFRRYPGQKMIIAPHEIERTRIDAILEKYSGIRYTACTEDNIPENARLLVIDTIGILSSAYRYCAYGYIGGGFGAGIHNTLEAAAFGLPLAFGPNYHKFREAAELISIGAARSINSAGELAEWFDAVSGDAAEYERSMKASLSFISSHKGATEIILQHIFG